MFKRIISERALGGLAMVLVPLVFIWGFASHPNLGDFGKVTQAAQWVQEIRGNSHLALAHLVVLLCAPLFILMAGELKTRIRPKEQVLATAGYILVIFGAMALAADKGALCLVPGAFDTLPDSIYNQLLPGLQTLLDRSGPLWVLNLLFLLPLGFFLLGIGLWHSGNFKKWNLVFLMVGMVLFLNPDIDILSLAASLFMALGLVPMGLKVLRE